MTSARFDVAYFPANLTEVTSFGDWLIDQSLNDVKAADPQIISV